MWMKFAKQQIKLAQDYVPEWEREKKQRPFVAPGRKNDSGMPEIQWKSEQPQNTQLTIPPWFESISVNDLMRAKHSRKLKKDLQSGYLSPNGEFFPIDREKHREFEREIFKNNNITKSNAILEDYGWQHISYGEIVDAPKTATQQQKDFLILWGRIIKMNSFALAGLNHYLGI